jgi:hypothetical protein
MTKDPAFLFYSKDFYTGTRTMLPKERACYLDLMIYQHQNQYIPDDIERISMFCTGIDEATLKATLEAKFKLCDKGWYNLKLRDVMEERECYSNKQSDNGITGQFFKKAKSALSAKKYNVLKDYIYKEFTKEKLIEELKKDEATHEALLEALLKHLEDEDAIVNEDVEVNKNIPEFSEFLNYALSKDSSLNKQGIKLKYEAWVENGWKNGYNKKIVNWKTALLNTIQYLPKEVKQNAIPEKKYKSADEIIREMKK